MKFQTMKKKPCFFLLKEIKEIKSKICEFIFFLFASMHVSLHAYTEWDRILPRKYSAESIGRVIVKDNDEVMIV